MKNQKNQKNLPSLYGQHAATEGWLNEERDINALYLTEQGQKSFESVLLQGKKRNLKRPEPIIIDKQKLEKMLPRSAVHQGIALFCRHLDESDIQDFIIRSKTQERTRLVILDQVTDPHNVGAILRSASAFGIDGVIMQKKHAPSLDGVLAKTACGAVDHIGVAPVTNLSRTILELRDEGFFVVGLDERGELELGPLLNSHSRPDKMVVVLGSEGEGIRRLVKESCDSLARLPTQGTIASLNVSNAAAVAFYAMLEA